MKCYMKTLFDFVFYSKIYFSQNQLSFHNFPSALYIFKWYLSTQQDHDLCWAGVVAIGNTLETHFPPNPSLWTPPSIAQSPYYPCRVLGWTLAGCCYTWESGGLGLLEPLLSSMVVHWLGVCWLVVSFGAVWSCQTLVFNYWLCFCRLCCSCVVVGGFSVMFGIFVVLFFWGRGLWWGIICWAEREWMMVVSVWIWVELSWIFSIDKALMPSTNILRVIRVNICARILIR